MFSHKKQETKSKLEPINKYVVDIMVVINQIKSNKKRKKGEKEQRGFLKVENRKKSN